MTSRQLMSMLSRWRNAAKLRDLRSSHVEIVVFRPIATRASLIACRTQVDVTRLPKRKLRGLSADEFAP
jgi:hypothetical protein